MEPHATVSSVRSPPPTTLASTGGRRGGLCIGTSSTASSEAKSGMGATEEPGPSYKESWAASSGISPGDAGRITLEILQV